MATSVWFGCKSLEKYVWLFQLPLPSLNFHVIQWEHSKRRDWTVARIQFQCRWPMWWEDAVINISIFRFLIFDFCTRKFGYFVWWQDLIFLTITYSCQQGVYHTVVNIHWWTYSGENTVVSIPSSTYSRSLTFVSMQLTTDSWQYHVSHGPYIESHLLAHITERLRHPNGMFRVFGEWKDSDFSNLHDYIIKYTDRSTTDQEFLWRLRGEVLVSTGNGLG